jgi:hypothetical protein
MFFRYEVSPAAGVGVVNFDGSLTLTDTVSSDGKVALLTRCQQLRPPLFCETKAGALPSKYRPWFNRRPAETMRGRISSCFP